MKYYLRLIIPLFFTMALGLMFLPNVKRAEACRDCPFPMKVSDGRWLMPNRQLEVAIEESRAQGRLQKTEITLIDTVTREAVAYGSIRHSKGRRSYTVILSDRDGQPVEAHIRWLDRNHDRVQIILNCIEECSIANLL